MNPAQVKRFRKFIEGHKFFHEHMDEELASDFWGTIERRGIPAEVMLNWEASEATRQVLTSFKRAKAGRKGQKLLVDSPRADSKSKVRQNSKQK
jgi:hypothetical protein